MTGHGKIPPFLRLFFLFIQQSKRPLSHSQFTPPWFLRHRHLQTILNSVGPRKLKANRIIRELENTRQLVLEAGDGVRLFAEYDASHSDRKRLAVLFHGWEGSSSSAYVVTTARTLLDAGYSVLRVNFRDHGPSHHFNRELFNATMTTEVSNAIGEFLRLEPHGEVYLGGFSLGGNFALRIAADSAAALNLRAVVAISPPIDPQHATAVTGSSLYHPYFFRKWRKSLITKLALYPELGYADALKAARSLDELVDFFVPHHTPAQTPAEYYRLYGMAGDRLAALSIPGLLVTAEDDPIIPVEDLDKLNVPKSLEIEVHRHGGHCGFITSLKGDSWAESRILRFFEQCNPYNS